MRFFVAKEDLLYVISGGGYYADGMREAEYMRQYLIDSSKMKPDNWFKYPGSVDMDYTELQKFLGNLHCQKE